MSAEILVVSADSHVLSDRVTALRRAGFSARASSSFPDARRMLEKGPAPEILVTDVRLGPYNGLHLVAVARVEFPRAFAIVIGAADHVLEVEATGLGARYVSAPVTSQELQVTIAEVMAVERPRRRWPRKRLPVDVPAVIGGLPGRLLDVSYGGACLEVFGGVDAVGGDGHRHPRARHGPAGACGSGRIAPIRCSRSAAGCRCPPPISAGSVRRRRRLSRIDSSCRRRPARSAGATRADRRTAGAGCRCRRRPAAAGPCGTAGTACGSRTSAGSSGTACSPAAPC